MPDPLLAAGQAALEAGQWAEARDAFESSLTEAERPEACLGLATALWWLGENDASVAQASRAYALFRQAANVESAVQCALWLGITYKANFANFVAADGWIRRAERLLEPLPPGLLHGWVHVARAYRMPDLEAAEALTIAAGEIARAAGDADLELGAMSQLGLIRVGRGRTVEGFALIDEAMAAVLAGERSNLETVVYTCCDMLNACELASDLERAAQWCRVADDFVDTYGCPFLYAECRIYYGSVLLAKGRWDDADRGAEHRRADHRGSMSGPAHEGVDSLGRIACPSGPHRGRRAPPVRRRCRCRGRDDGLSRRHAARSRRRASGQPAAREAVAAPRRAPHPPRHCA